MTTAREQAVDALREQLKKPKQVFGRGRPSPNWEWVELPLTHAKTILALLDGSGEGKERITDNELEELSEKTRNEVNEQAPCCVGEAEENVFDTAFFMGYRAGEQPATPPRRTGDWDEIEKEWDKDWKDIEYTKERIFQWFRSRLSDAQGDGWVSVKERLPEHNVPVLILTDYGKQDVCRLCSYEHGLLWNNDMRPQHSNGNVIAWQPLTSPSDKK